MRNRKKIYSFETDLESAGRDADLVIEAVLEKMELKIEFSKGWIVFVRKKPF